MTTYNAPYCVAEDMDRTVTTATEGTNRGDMNVIGYIIAAGVLIVLLPVLPLLLVLEIIERLSSGDATDRGVREFDTSGTAGDE